MLELMTNEKKPRRQGRENRRRVRVAKLPDWLPRTVRERLARRCRDMGGSLPVEIRFSRGERVAMRHRKPVPVSEWAERHRVVHNSSVPGRWHNEIAPYSAGIMDASFFPSVQTVIVCKTPQTGLTEATHNCIGYAVDRDPGPVMYVYPDETTARENATDRIIPMFEASKRLRSYLTAKADDRSSIRVNLSHMAIYLAWSGSVSRLSNKPIRYLVLDELDKYQNPKKETTSEALAEARTITWKQKKKIWKLSTPSDASSPIWRALNEEAEVVFDYWVHCPHCNTEQLMEFDRIRWPENVRDPKAVESRRLAYYTCEHCGGCWDDHERDQAVRRGFWKARGTGLELFVHLRAHRPVKIGFHLPSWLSYFVSLSTVAASFLRWDEAAKANKPNAKDYLKDFMNSHRAEPWVEYVKERSEDRILALCDDRPRGRVPGPRPDESPEVAALVAGVDTQKGYLRYVIRAFGYGEDGDSWLVQYGSLPSFGAMEEVVLRSVFRDKAGNEHSVRLTMQDAMGNRTSEVYSFAARHRGRVMATQGKQSQAAPLKYTKLDYFPNSQKAIPGGLQLVKVDTHFFKSDLAARLAIEPGDPGSFRLHADTSDEYAKEMCAEYYDDKSQKWICPSGKANHFWDCEVLALAAAWQLGVRNWKRPGKKAEASGKSMMPPKVAQVAGVGRRPGWFARR